MNHKVSIAPPWLYRQGFDFKPLFIIWNIFPPGLFLLSSHIVFSMHYSFLSFSLLLVLLPFIALVHAWDFTQLFQQELQNEGLTGLANLLTTVNQTSTGQALLSQISQGNYTFFAPIDEAIQKIPTEISSNTTLLAEYLSYHFVHGNFQNVSAAGGAAGGATSSIPCSTTATESSAAGESPSSTMTESATATESSATGEGSSSTVTVTATAALFERLFGRQANIWSWLDTSSPQIISGVYPNITLGRTLLNSSDLVMLPGNKSQVLAWTRIGENGNVTILNQRSDIDPSGNVTVINATQWNNLFINRINGVLIPPGNISTALNATNATFTLELLSAVQVPSSNGTNESALEFLQEARGITLFAPNNESFTSEVNQTIDSLRSNQTAATALLMNHYINGTVLYSPVIQALGENTTSPNVTSAAGEPLSFITNSTGLFVEGPSGSSAQIVRPDVLIDNGVIHIIDRVLITNESDPSAASSAFASATSAAASSTTETEPIGVSTTTSGVSTSSETSSSSPSPTSGATTSEGTVTVTASA